MKYIIVTCLLFGAINVFSQEKQGKVMYMTKSNTDKYVVVDTVDVRVWYALNALDIHDENTYIDLQRLEIGKTRNKYYSYFVWESDSLITEYQKKNNSASFPSKLAPRGRGGKGYWNELQFHTWFMKNGKVRTYTREPDKSFNGYYDEVYPAMKWTLTQETDTICGYHCQKALTHYHGRDFEAWFTTEVPLNYGPWKFGGLPGLIIKVYDKDKFYTFECVNLESVHLPMMSHPYNKHRSISREKVLKFERKVNENASRVLGYTRLDGHPILPVHYEPIELE